MKSREQSPSRISWETHELTNSTTDRSDHITDFWHWQRIFLVDKKQNNVREFEGRRAFEPRGICRSAPRRCHPGQLSPPPWAGDRRHRTSGAHPRTFATTLSEFSVSLASRSPSLPLVCDSIFLVQKNDAYIVLAAESPATRQTCTTAN